MRVARPSATARLMACDENPRARKDAEWTTPLASSTRSRSLGLGIHHNRHISAAPGSVPDPWWRSRLLEPTVEKPPQQADKRNQAACLRIGLCSRARLIRVHGEIAARRWARHPLTKPSPRQANMREQAVFGCFRLRSRVCLVRADGENTGCRWARGTRSRSPCRNRRTCENRPFAGASACARAFAWFGLTGRTPDAAGRSAPAAEAEPARNRPTCENRPFSGASACARAFAWFGLTGRTPDAVGARHGRRARPQQANMREQAGVGSSCLFPCVRLHPPAPRAPRAPHAGRGVSRRGRRPLRSGSGERC